MDSSKFKERVILHCDMNNFYASVECKLNPSLKDIPMAVGGSEENRAGIILAKNEIAKSYGVVTAEALWQARQKCKDIVIVPPHFDEYAKYSKLAMEIYERFTDQVESYGLDEAWLDVTGSKIFGNGIEIAEQIRQIIKDELGLTISIGVSFNKVFAKLGSDMKKPDAITVITKNDFKQKVWTLNAEELLGVGSSTKKTLTNLGVKTIGDLANISSDILVKHLGKNGHMLHEYANGLDSSRVKSIVEDSSPKSIGHGTTTVKDLVNSAEIWYVILELSQDIGTKLRKENKKAGGISISVRNSEMKNKSFQCQLSIPTQSAREIADNCFKLFQEKYVWNFNIRAVTVTAINLIDENEPVQFSLFTDFEAIEKRKKLDNTIEDLREKYGKKSVVNAVLLKDNKMSKNSHHDIIMPNSNLQ